MLTRHFSYRENMNGESVCVLTDRPLSLTLLKGGLTTSVANTPFAGG